MMLLLQNTGRHFVSALLVRIRPPRRWSAGLIKTLTGPVVCWAFALMSPLKADNWRENYLRRRKERFIEIESGELEKEN